MFTQEFAIKEKRLETARDRPPVFLKRERPFFPGLHQLRLRVGVVRPCRMSYAYLFK